MGLAAPPRSTVTGAAAPGPKLTVSARTGRAARGAASRGPRITRTGARRASSKDTVSAFTAALATAASERESAARWADLPPNATPAPHASATTASALVHAVIPPLPLLIPPEALLAKPESLYARSAAAASGSAMTAPRGHDA